MATLGNANKCYVGTSISGTWTVLAGESTNSVNFSSNPVEVSDKSGAWQKYIAGLRGGTADVTVYADNTDTNQQTFIKGMRDGDSVFLFIGQMSTGSSATPSAGVAFEAIVSSLSDTNDNGSVSSRAISLQITGTPTFYPTMS